MKGIVSALPQRDSAAVFTRTERVNAALAVEWLTRNTLNRPLTRSVVQRYARDMREGRWQLNGETIKFAPNGVLLDGQHRLEALLLAYDGDESFAVEFLVAYNVAPDTFVTIDTGSNRTGSDVLALAGERSATWVAGAAKILMRLRDGKGRLNYRLVYTNAELLSFVEAHPGIRDSLQPARVAHALMGAAIPTGLHYAFTHSKGGSADAATLFFRQLGAGEGITRRDAVYWLRERVLRSRTGREKLHRDSQIELTIKAWQRRNEKTTTLRIQAGEQVKLDLKL